MQGPLFALAELGLVSQALRRGELLVAHHYRIPALPSRQYPYEVVTLADIAPEERAPGTLAHLVVYERARPSGETEHLYRICLQDDVILARAAEAGSEGLAPLLFYVLTHELVHVVRFQRAERSFAMEQHLREEEEGRVHQITLELLQAAAEPGWQRLDDRYGNPVIPARLVRG